MNANPLSHAIARALMCYAAADAGVFCLAVKMTDTTAYIFLRLPGSV